MAKLFHQITQLLDGSVDAAVVLDAERRVLHYNQAYEALTGLRGRQLAEKVKAGARCHELFKLEICEQACLGCKVREVGRRLRVDEIGARRGDGEDLTFIVTAAPVELDDGEAVVVETYRDVTADVRTRRLAEVDRDQNKEMQEKRAALEEALATSVATQTQIRREVDTQKIEKVAIGQAALSAARQRAVELKGQLDAQYSGRKAEIDAFRVQPVERVMERLGQRLEGVTIEIQPWANDSVPSRLQIERAGGAL